MLVPQPRHILDTQEAVVPLQARLFWGHHGALLSNWACPMQGLSTSRVVNRKLEGALAFMEDRLGLAWSIHPLLLGAFSKSFQEDPSGQAPDNGIPGGMRFSEELRGCQRDKCCAEEAQGWAGCLSGQGKAVTWKSPL